MRLEIPRELRSPNAWLWKHWRVKQREREVWELEIATCLLKPQHRRDPVALLLAMNAVPKARRLCDEKRRVTVTRFCPSGRNFIRDEDNLRFAVKPLNDALKRLGLIRDDSRKWLEQPMPTQEVATDGRWRTVIEIEPLLATAGQEQAV